MLRKINKPNIITLNEARKQYPQSKLIFIVEDMSDMSNIKGIVFMVSDSDESYDELCEEEEKLLRDGKQTMIVGSYENGGAVGVQYEIRS